MSQVFDAIGLTADDVAAIRGTIEPWRNACVQRDWDGLLEMCTDDIVFLPPNEPTVEGGGVRRWLDNFPAIKAMALEIDRVEGAGHLACVKGFSQDDA
jgi:ketosteroid isomerase-like protein